MAINTRRSFLRASAAVATAVRPILGANDRVRMALIGAGVRGNLVQKLFRTHEDCEFVAVCDVYESRLGETIASMGGKLAGYGDYRRVIERGDVDAVLVATPDHWHSPITVDACAAGKDVYCEKPASNAIEPGLKMVEAARKYNRVVQLGTQQRSSAHFKEAAEIVGSGKLGTVSHVMMAMAGGETQKPLPPEPVPEGLDWEMFQGPAPRRPFNRTRLNWRTYYAYGGGQITDWGVHLVDSALMFMNADHKTPLLTSVSAQYTEVNDTEQIPNAFVCSWQYDNFVMSFTNVVPPNRDWQLHGNFFYGTNGVLQVHRQGYRVIPGQDRRGAASGAAALQPKMVRADEQYFGNDPFTIAHTRNFLDCVKSRRRPVSDIEIGFNSTLPTLLALLAVQKGRAFRWDGKKAIAV